MPVIKRPVTRRAVHKQPPPLPEYELPVRARLQRKLVAPVPRPGKRARCGNFESSRGAQKAYIDEGSTISTRSFHIENSTPALSALTALSEIAELGTQEGGSRSNRLGGRTCAGVTPVTKYLLLAGAEGIGGGGERESFRRMAVTQACGNFNGMVADGRLGSHACPSGRSMQSTNSEARRGLKPHPVWLKGVRYPTGRVGSDNWTKDPRV